VTTRQTIRLDKDFEAKTSRDVKIDDTVTINSRVYPVPLVANESVENLLDTLACTICKKYVFWVAA
jgi:hypothetical protein